MIFDHAGVSALANGGKPVTTEDYYSLRLRSRLPESVSAKSADDHCG
jgi:hypothetical protein